jgi:hypothetical protein
MFKQDLEVIDALRRDAVNVREPHTSGIRKIAAYAGQLSWMGGKFPIDVCLANFSSFMRPSPQTPGLAACERGGEKVGLDGSGFWGASGASFRRQG